MRKMVNVSMTVPLAKRLEDYQTISGLSITEIVRRAVEEYLKTKEGN